MDYDRLSGLKVKDYQFPDEDKYIDKLRAMPFFDKVAGQYLAAVIEFSNKAEYTGNGCRVSSQVEPRVYKQYQKALKRLDMPEEYPLYMSFQYEYNASAFGGERPFIVLHSSLAQDCTDEELAFVIGHELGHIKSNHSVYKYIAANMVNLLGNIKYIGVPAVAAMSFALSHWDRCAEFTCDRAGAIAAGSCEAGILAHAKLLGSQIKTPFLQLDTNMLLEQNESFNLEIDDVYGKLLYAYFTAGASHPWLPMRIKELKEWEESGQFQAVINKYR